MKLCKLSLLTAMLAAAVCARAQNAKLVNAGEAYPITSSVHAEGVGTRNYQWFRNDTLINAATGADYTVPANLAYGSNVRFVRRALYDGACDGAGIAYSNTVTVTFVEPAPPGCPLYVQGVCWTDANLMAPGVFVSSPDAYGAYFYWNNLGDQSSATWTINPCPSTWRLPTIAEFANLLSTSNPQNGVWAAANAKGNAMAGRFFGYNASSCSLPSNMSDCIFLPAAGYSSGIYGSYGFYWSSTEYSQYEGYSLQFSNSFATWNNDMTWKSSMMLTIRCVK